MNDVPLHSKDKSGFNVAILIAQILCLIALDRFDDILEKGDALKVYAQRYIREKDKFRTYYFMKMLQVMIKYSFEPKKTEQIARKFLDQLTTTRKSVRPLEEMEIVPYEKLWQTILERLREAE